MKEDVKEIKGSLVQLSGEVGQLTGKVDQLTETVGLLAEELSFVSHHVAEHLFTREEAVEMKNELRGEMRKSEQRFMDFVTRKVDEVKDEINPKIKNHEKRLLKLELK